MCIYPSRRSSQPSAISVPSDSHSVALANPPSTSLRKSNHHALPNLSRLEHCDQLILLFEHFWLSDHDIHSQLFSCCSLQIYLLLQLISHLAVDDQINVMRAFKIAWKSLSVSLSKSADPLSHIVQVVRTSFPTYSISFLA